MKKKVLLFISLLFTILTYSQSNILQEGNDLFAQGNYAGAIEKYKAAIKIPDKRQQKIAGDNLKLAENCFELKRLADIAFNEKKYDKSKEYYLNILNENSTDQYSIARLKVIKYEQIHLSVSKKNVLYLKSGGEENIFVNTDADTFSIKKIPSWLNVKKFEKYISISCSENISRQERIDSLQITAGSKSEIIRIRQSNEQKITLNISKTQIYFYSIGGISDSIFVYTNASNYFVSLLPSWCSVKAYKNYFVLSCKSNLSNKSRSDWIKVSAEKQEVKLFVTQAGSDILPQYSQHNELSKKIEYNKYLFINFGAVVNSLDYFENVTAALGGRKFYVRIKFSPKMISKSENYSTTLLSSKLEITNSSRVINFPSSSGYYYVVSSETVNNRQSFTFGTSFGGKKLRLYFGGGYGERLNLWSLNLKSYNGNTNAGYIWAKNINQSWKGVETEMALFLKLNRLNIMVGLSTVLDSRQRVPYLDCHLGFGFSTR